ncbi:uncharacterized protein BDZ83DRAFT_647917 [Colletotrichum acutatum]|uniref:Uncharacterized protein n=1 Tax=Glomerella acutata TaxID=27357 RepID=A0AAD8XKW1_GLOAC|nr:uncharacterized protein BDZ83DRAFT_647917 [Colletotrichum acutatum]KAK1729268.1 hypothetical protein BDZ83DRAFT_647917 [Colletotrichum acutatum]
MEPWHGPMGAPTLGCVIDYLSNVGVLYEKPPPDLHLSSHLDVPQSLFWDSRDRRCNMYVSRGSICDIGFLSAVIDNGSYLTSGTTANANFCPSLSISRFRFLPPPPPPPHEAHPLPPKTETRLQTTLQSNPLFVPLLYVHSDLAVSCAPGP